MTSAHLQYKLLLVDGDMMEVDNVINFTQFKEIDDHFYEQLKFLVASRTQARILSI